MSTDQIDRLSICDIFISINRAARWYKMASGKNIYQVHALKNDRDCAPSHDTFCECIPDLVPGYIYEYYHSNGIRIDYFLCAKTVEELTTKYKGLELCAPVTLVRDQIVAWAMSPGLL